MKVFLATLAQSSKGIVEGMSGRGIKVIRAALCTNIGCHVRHHASGNNDVQNNVLKRLRDNTSALICQCLLCIIKQRLNAGTCGKSSSHKRAVEQLNFSGRKLNLRALRESVTNSRPEVLIRTLCNNLRINKGMNRKLSRNEVRICRTILFIENSNSCYRSAVRSKCWEGKVWLVQDGCNLFTLINCTTTTNKEEHISSNNLRHCCNSLGICVRRVGAVRNPRRDRNLRTRKCSLKLWTCLLHCSWSTNDYGIFAKALNNVQYRLISINTNGV